jgi:hypothetical protein
MRSHLALRKRPHLTPKLLLLICQSEMHSVLRKPL